MEKEGKVSLWLGNFGDEESFREFMESTYTDDGDYIPSKFEMQFKIEYYDIDFSEVDYMEEQSNNLEVLLKGASYDYEIIPKFKAKHDGHMYNSIVLLYDFEYDANKINYINENNILDFIGCVDYRK